jgi:hypothetical protein
VLVAPQIDPIPYVLNYDYAGSYTTHLDPCGNEVDLDFTSPGTYTAKVLFADGSTYTEFLYAGSGAGNIMNFLFGQSRQQKIDLPAASAGGYIVEAQVQGQVNPFDTNVAKVVPNPVTVRSVQGAIDAVNAAFQNNGNQPVDIFLAGSW